MTYIYTYISCVEIWAKYVGGYEVHTSSHFFYDRVNNLGMKCRPVQAAVSPPAFEHYSKL